MPGIILTNLFGESCPSIIWATLPNIIAVAARMHCSFVVVAVKSIKSFENYPKFSLLTDNVQAVQVNILQQMHLNLGAHLRYEYNWNFENRYSFWPTIPFFIFLPNSTHK